MKIYKGSLEAGLKRQVAVVWAVGLLLFWLTAGFLPWQWAQIAFTAWIGGMIFVQHKVISRCLEPLQQLIKFIEKGEKVEERFSWDETERLKTAISEIAENSETSLQQQIRFTADASHELRTPVAVILAQTQVALSRERQPAEYVESLKMCRRAGERMKSLLEELLDLSKFDAGAFRLRLAECDLADLAKESIAFVEPLAGERRVAVESETISVQHRVDPSAFGRALINLLTNAIIHNPPETRVRLTIRSTTDSVCITISDNGLGIPEETLPRIFERFARGDKSRTRATGGTGLGLAIVRAIVHSHGGEIRAESQVGQGTKFVILLP